MRASDLIFVICLVLLALALSIAARWLGGAVAVGTATIADAAFWWRQRRRQRQQLDLERRRLDAFHQFSSRLAAFSCSPGSHGFFFLDKWAADQVEPEAYRLGLAGVRFERRDGCKHVRVIVER